MNTENWTLSDYASAANAAEAAAAEHNAREAWIAAAEAWEAYANHAIEIDARFQVRSAATKVRDCRARVEELSDRNIGGGWTRTDERHYAHESGAVVAKSPSGRWQAFYADKQAVRTGGRHNVKLFGSPEAAAAAALAE